LTTAIRARVNCLLVALAAACGAPSVEDRVRSMESGLVEDLSATGWAGKALSERMT